MSLCRICGNAIGNKTYSVREMQFGLREEFEYFECALCGCLQIKQIPEDLGKYYPKNYYSYRPANSTLENGYGRIKQYKARFIRDQITKYYLKRNNKLGAWLERESCLSKTYPDSMTWIKQQRLNLGFNQRSHILDVGCGNGHLLNDMAAHGFSNLLGIDPFIERDISYDNGVKIIKKELEEIEQRFDFIMLHHSFEHMMEPLQTLKKLYALLKPKRYLLIRIPVTASYLWRKYGVDWAGLDAPRHLHLHTRESMNLLAKQSGLKIADVVFDADSLTTIASEQYIRDIPMVDSRSFFVNPSQTFFSKEELDFFKRQDQELNQKGDGDCAGFYLYKN